MNRRSVWHSIVPVLFATLFATLALPNVASALPPVITRPASIAPTEDTVFAFTGGNTISVSDPDAGTTNITVQVQCVGHTLAATATGSLSSVTGNGTATLTMVGPQAAQNTALASLTLSPALNATGSITVAVTCTDNTASSDNENIPGTIAPVNDRPVLTSISAISNTEDSSNAVSITISDVDIRSTIESGLVYNVSISASNGTLRSDLELTNVTNMVVFTIGKPGAITNKAYAFSGAYSNVNVLLNSLYYVGVRDYNGGDTLSVSVNDNGNVGSGGSLITNRAISITLSAVNDAPRINNFVDQLTDEDVAIGIDLSDIDEADIAETPGAQLRVNLSVTTGTMTLASTTGITITNGANGSASIQFRGLLADVTTALNLLNYAPPSNFFGAATLSVNVNDNGATGSGGVQSIGTNLTITINSVNDAPVLDNTGTMTLTGINENNTNSAGNAVSNIILSAGGNRITDADAGAVEGIAVTGSDTTNGVWQFSTNGGSSWNTMGVLADGSAVVLDPSALIRFVPNPFFSGSSFIQFRAWDQTDSTPNGTIEVDASATGTPNPYSTATETATITVTDVNNAPTLDNSGDLTLTDVNEDQIVIPGDTVTAVLASGGGDPITDGDASPVEGVAVIGVDNSNGAWQYSTNGGSTFQAFGSPSDATARLLNTNALFRYVPNANTFGTATITFRAWDQTTGSNGGTGNAGVNGGTTAFSTGIETALVTVVSLNDAPVLDNTGTMTLSNVAEEDPNPAGNTVAAIILSAGGNRITDGDAGALEGIAVVAADNSNGQWEFSTDGGSNWNGITGPSAASAVTLADTSLLRFVPGNNFAGSATITFHAWDQTDGSGDGAGAVDASSTGGTNAFSTASETASVSVGAVNDAPVLDNSGTMTLSSINEDAAAPAGNTVAAIVLSAGGDRITDDDAGALEGVAVIGVNNTNGVWEFSINAGATWNPVGAVSPSSARTLDDASLLRFIPAANFNGTAEVTFRAWDQTDGSSDGSSGVDATSLGGTNAFSVDETIATITVNAQNDAPLLDNTGTMTLLGILVNQTNNAGDTIAAIIGSAGGDRITDVDTAALEGVAVISADTLNGSWQFSTNGGSSWLDLGSVTPTSALLLNTFSKVRFRPNLNYVGTASIQFRAWDQTSGSLGQSGVDVSVNGGTTAFSTASEFADITVSSNAVLNAAPVLDNTGLPVLPNIRNDDTTSAGRSVSNIIASAGGNRITDADAGALEGIAVITVDNANGSWQYSTDNGTNWLAFGAPANNSATLLDPAAIIRFVPTPGFIGTASFLFRAWDQTAGINGQTAVNAASNGGSTPFSTATESAQITVNAIPTARNDFDGDGTSDVGVIDPASWAWSIFRSADGFQSFVFGFNKVKEVNADYDGDGKSDPAVFDDVSGTWYIFRSTLGFTTIQYGFPGVVPVPGDYDGDGTADLCVYDPAFGNWIMFRSTKGPAVVQFGYSPAVPVPADYDGDGTTDLAVFDDEIGTWYLLLNTAGFRTFKTVQFGFDGVVPVPGDYDGDGIADIGVYFAKTGQWTLYRSRDGFQQTVFGFNKTIPVPADYDGDTIEDLCIFDPATGTWSQFRSTLGFTSFVFGFSGVNPVGPAP